MPTSPRSWTPAGARFGVDPAPTSARTRGSRWCLRISSPAGSPRGTLYALIDKSGRIGRGDGTSRASTPSSVGHAGLPAILAAAKTPAASGWREQERSTDRPSMEAIDLSRSTSRPSIIARPRARAGPAGRRPRVAGRPGAASARRRVPPYAMVALRTRDIVLAVAVHPALARGTFAMRPRRPCPPPLFRDRVAHPPRWGPCGPGHVVRQVDEEWLVASAGRSSAPWRGFPEVLEAVGRLVPIALRLASDPLPAACRRPGRRNRDHAVEYLRRRNLRT
jgi:hypothetical protein